MTGDGVSELLQRAAGYDPGDPPVETLMRRGRHRRLRRRLGVATTTAVVVLAAAVVASQATQFRIELAPGEQGDASAPVLALPAPGEVSPQWLPDGTPVFVVADEDGTAAVVEALSTHRVSLWDKLVGWCTSAEIFEDPHHGAEWGPHGNYFGGPAPTGLATYAARVEGGQVHVGARQPPTARGEGPATERAGPSCSWPDVRHTPDDAPWPTITPEQVAEHDGPVVVSGTIINHSDGSARMCSQLSVGPPPRCPPDSPHVTGAEPRLQDSAHTGTYVAVADDGDLHSPANLGDVDSEYFGPRPRSYSGSDPINVEDGVITVPAVDIERNLLWLVFTKAAVRDLISDWETEGRRLIAQFRAEAGPRLPDAAYADLVARLREASEQFAEWWDRRDVAFFASRERAFDHPVVGRLVVEHHKLALADDPRFHVVVYTPVAGTGTPARLARLVADAAS